MCVVGNTHHTTTTMRKGKKRKNIYYMKKGGVIESHFDNRCKKLPHSKIQAKKLANTIGKRIYKCNICNYYHLTSIKDDNKIIRR